MCLDYVLLTRNGSVYLGEHADEVRSTGVEQKCGYGVCDMGTISYQTRFNILARAAKRG